MIRFGPAGIPLSCKGRTLEDGIEDVHNLSLGALEIQLVRAGAYPRPPEDEEVGMTLKDIEEDFVIEILRDGESICDPDEPIEEDDDLVYMPSGVASTFGDLYPIGEMAKRLDVNMSIHTPYYMDLGSDDELAMECMNSIRYAGSSPTSDSTTGSATPRTSTTTSTATSPTSWTGGRATASNRGSA